MKKSIEKLKKISNEIDLIVAAIRDESDETTVVFDGIIDVHKYLNSKHKILWILKEANDSDGGYDMRDGILKRIKTNYGLIKEARPTFEPIIYTTYGILYDCYWDGISDLSKDTSIADIIEHIGFVNLKKLPGGALCNSTKLKEDYLKNGHIVIKQIDEYEPNIVIFGGTDYLLINDLGLIAFEIDLGLNEIGFSTCWVKNNCLYIRAYHPAQNNIKKCNYCNNIISAVREWEKLNIKFVKDLRTQYKRII